MRIGFVGLGRMGSNMVRRILRDSEHEVVAFDRGAEQVRELAALGATGAGSLEELVAGLDAPRHVWVMVPAGAPTQETIEALHELLDPGDLIVDGGNSRFVDSRENHGRAAERGVEFVDAGVSGGIWGLDVGYCTMVGGTPEGVARLAPVLDVLAPTGGWLHVGAGGAGHYVKMVHNGIEYGDMQLICEAYAILKATLAPSAEELAGIFGQWNEGELNSFLIEITAHIFTKKDPETGQALVDRILDKAGQKGTGKWTVGHAIEMGVPLSVIGSAVEARILSSLKDERVAASKVLTGPSPGAYKGDRTALIEAVRDALYASKIISYAQGMVQLGKAGELYKWNLNFGDIASIWRGGCIIRARFLNRITEAYRKN
nr:NADP-dependent phosphogluconate dehydrogenase [Thermoleophilaceae bacterium]